MVDLRCNFAYQYVSGCLLTVWQGLPKAAVAKAYPPGRATMGRCPSIIASSAFCAAFSYRSRSSLP